VGKYSIRSMIQPPQDDYFWYFWASCLEIGKNRIPKITRNNYSVARIIVLKFQNDILTKCDRAPYIKSIVDNYCDRSQQQLKRAIQPQEQCR
jgi:hypothetical protein